MEDFIYINLKKATRNRCCEIEKFTAKVHYVTKGDGVKNPYYCITFNKEISEKINNKGLKYVRLRKNTITSELYLIFCKEETDDSLKVTTKTGRVANTTIYSKGFVEIIGRLLGIDTSALDGYILNIGDDKSRIDDIVCLQIKK